MSEISTQTSANLSELSFAELAAMEGAEVAVGSDLKDKDELVGIPFAITAFFFRPSDQSSREYVSVEATTQNGEKVVFNDGGSGIRETLANWTVSKRIVDHEATDDRTLSIVEHVSANVPEFAEVTFGDEDSGTLAVTLPTPLICTRGLRKSSYPAKGEKGKPGYRPAGTTYYIG